MAQNDKKLCLSHFISQESFIIWMSFMVVHLCEMMISVGIFFVFFKFLIFWVARGVKRQKMVQNEKKCCLLYSISQYLHIYSFYWLISTVFLINSCFLCSSINAKQKFWDVPHLLHMYLIFLHVCSFADMTL